MADSQVRSPARAAFRLGARRIAPDLNAVGDTRVDAKAMDVLVALADAAPGVLSASDLLDRVWSNVVVGDNVVHQAIAHLRSALGDRAREPTFIEHVPRRGYRLIAPIERLAPTTPSDDAPSEPRHNLPAPLNEFVGRADEIARVRELLDAHRLVTITGVGGAGKTRLALELAAAATRTFPDGVWFVELGSITDASRIGPTIAATLHVAEVRGKSAEPTLFDALRGKRLLLLLDNCEHLIDACARTVAALLKNAPRLAVLATSREALGIAGEHAWRIASLAVPDADRAPLLDELGAVESVHLLVQRAREVQPDFAVTADNASAIAQICQRLDGIPLAIELAAARLRAMSPEQICARLDDRFRLLTGGNRTAVPRQQTLTATFDWSHALLDANEQVLLRRLGVFSGSWSLDAAEAVAAFAPLTTPDVVDLVVRLLDKSWLHIGGGAGDRRYRMLETVKQYANARLVDTGEAATVRDRHRDYFIAFAQRSARELRGREQRGAFMRFDAEHDNLCAALAWCGDAATGLALANNLWRYWMLRSLASTGRRALDELLAQVPDSPATAAARAHALLGAGWMARFQGDYETAEAQLSRSVALFAGTDDAAGEAEALCNLARCRFYFGDADEGTRLAALAVDTARKSRDPFVISYCLEVAGEQRANGGDFAGGLALLTEATALLRPIGHEQRLAFTLAKLGDAQLRSGDLARARLALEEAYALHNRLGDGLGVDHTLLRLGWLAHHEGRDADAEARLTRGVEIALRAGFVPEAALALAMLGRIALQGGDVPRATSLLHDALRRGHSVRALDACAAALEGIAAVAVQQNGAEPAAHLIGAAEQVREGARRPLAPIERSAHEQTLRAVRQALGKAGFEAARKRGRAMHLDDAVHEALAAR